MPQALDVLWIIVGLTLLASVVFIGPDPRMRATSDDVISAVGFVGLCETTLVLALLWLGVL